VRNQKSQVTLFIILGIVLLIVFSFVLYVKNMVSQEALQRQAEQLVSDFLQENSITYYVQTCLSRVTNEELYLIGEHGGVREVTGTLGEDYLDFNDDGDIKTIMYGLVPNDKCPAVSDNPPEYPFDQTFLSLPAPYARLSGAHTIYAQRCLLIGHNWRSGFFGYPSLPKLCYLTGENGPRATHQYSLQCTIPDTAITPDESEESLQRQLENNIRDKLLECVDFSFYEDLGHTINLREDDVTVRLIYGFDSTTAVATFPFEVSIGGKKPIITRKDFTYTSPVRLRRVYEFLAELLQNDAQEAAYNKTKEYYSVSMYDPSLNVTFYKNACESCTVRGAYDDVIKVEDKKAVVENKTYVFYTAIKNRRPALDWIHEEYTGYGAYDIQAIENERIIIQPEGYDPDDTDVTYTYEGWKETYDEEYDDTLPGCSPSDLYNCIRRLPTPPPVKWTDSPRYQATHKDAEYQTTTADIGPHDVTITITDEEGLTDFQTVRILVFDLPVADPRGDNHFPTLNNNIASIEDPYTLDASHSRTSMIMNQPLSLYSWEATRNDGVTNHEAFTIVTSEPVITIPRAYAPVRFTDPPISGPYTHAQPHTLTLVVTAGNINSQPATMNVDVYQCIPNRNRNPTTGAVWEFSYPYNRTGITTYEYDHTCCQGTIQPTGTLTGGTITSTPTCFNQTLYGYLPGFRALLSRPPNPTVMPPSYRLTIVSPLGHRLYDNYVPLTDLPLLFPQRLYNIVETWRGTTYHRYENDVFKRTIERRCDGTRGNTCTGPITDTIEIYDQCNDWETPQEDERCQGPGLSPSYSTFTFETNCKNYDYLSPYKSFEQAFALPDRHKKTADGICNPTTKCSATRTPSSYKTLTTSGPFACVGGCKGSTGTCDYAVCSCSTTECGATCDNYQDYEYYYDATTGIMRCSYGCDLTTTCDYAYDVPCPHTCINDPTGNSCPASHDPSQEETCYYSNNPCSYQGCNLEMSEELREQYCDECTTSGTQQGNYCPPPGTINGNICYYQDSSHPYTCTGRTCNLGTSYRPASCAGTLTCDPTQGWTCTITP